MVAAAGTCNGRSSSDILMMRESETLGVRIFALLHSSWLAGRNSSSINL